MNDVTNIFSKRLRELRGSLRQQTVAEALDISRVSLSYYESGERKPDIEILAKLAKYYNVSCDYLLGFSDIKSFDNDIKSIYNYTGLNESSINTLNQQYINSTKPPTDGYDIAPALSDIYLRTLNLLLEPSCEIIPNIANYLFSNFDYYFDIMNDYEEIYQPINELGLFDKKLGIAYSNYNHLTQTFLLMIQEELIQLRKESQKNLPERITSPIKE